MVRYHDDDDDDDDDDYVDNYYGCMILVVMATLFHHIFCTNLCIDILLFNNCDDYNRYHIYS